MKTINLFLLSIILLFGNSGIVEAQGKKLAKQKSNTITFSIKKLTELTDKITALSPKAINGTISDRKQIVEFVAERNATKLLLGAFSNHLTADQNISIEELDNRIPSEIAENEMTLLEGLETPMIKENLANLSKEADKLIDLYSKAVDGKADIEQAFVETLIQIYKSSAILGNFNLNETQWLEFTQIVNKLEVPSNIGQSMNIFQWLVNNDQTDSVSGASTTINNSDVTAKRDDILNQYESVLDKMADLMIKQIERQQQIAIKFEEKVNAIQNNTKTNSSEN